MSSLTNDRTEKLQPVEVNLYPGYLPGMEGEYIARFNNLVTLTDEDIAVAMKERGGFTGNVEDLITNIRQYHDECAYQLCNGRSIKNKYYSMHPVLSGTFKNKHTGLSPDTHRLGFRLSPLAALRALAEHIQVIIAGIADTAGYIDQITDVTTDSINETVTKGGIFITLGHKIKLEGEGSGFYFYSPAIPGGPAASVKVTANFAENKPGRIVGTVPDLGLNRDWYPEVRTFYSGNNTKPLKEMRIIRSEFPVRQL
ncbi:MAG: DUF4469 domain-containing protein [Spirochaetaceae bacterium]|jgi:hypothetical protein|nr:DUF4469 domain-containing protein [Spirochaetaceae bacterium]